MKSSEVVIRDDSYTQMDEEDGRLWHEPRDQIIQDYAELLHYLKAIATGDLKKRVEGGKDM